jgi:hypothetical protein
MANIKTTDKQWAEAREYYEAGLSLSAIVKKTGISKAALSRKSNQDGWSKGTQKEQLIADAVRLERQKEQLSATALMVHNDIVADNVKAIMFFGNAAVENVREAMAMPCENQNDFRARADTINKGAERVLGKTPDTAIQVNTGAQSQEKVINVVFRGTDGK